MGRAIRYKQESKPEYGQKAAQTWTFTFDPAPHPDRVRLQGECPVCGHPSEFPWPLNLVRDIAANSAELPVPVFCRCLETHPGSRGEPGCGRAWTLMVPRP
ncbi:MAG TPA: hypothetical protein VFI46_04855 [Jiangellaceae bacterium]|nr:hypothetical protein [Jiangellaceae bacterium]